MSSPSATDVISYIGIPLAVLGALPIIYTCVRSIVTLQGVRRRLRDNGLTDVTRGSLMSGVVEVELPRCSITPLNRDDPEYWLVSPKPSTLKGGMWTTLHWNRILTGHKLYRLQYSDELQEPQAEIDFEELFNYLLDRGAVPNVKGIHMLQQAGLWTPTGTSLLLAPDGVHSALEITMLDDSDGILSLTLHWQDAWDRQDNASLQLTWIRVQNYQSFPNKSEPASGREKEPQTKEKEALQDTPKLSSESSHISPPPAIRFHIGVRAGQPTIDAAFWDGYPSPMTTDSKKYPQPSIAHLHEPLPSTYIPSFAIALAQLSNQPPWTTHFPPSITALASRDIIPLSVLVLVSFLPESDAPAIFTTYEPNEDAIAMSRKMQQRMQRITAENRLPPAQAMAARAMRETEERSTIFDGFQAKQKRDRERAEKKDIEGLNSTRIGNTVAAQAALTCLRSQKESGFENCEDLHQAVKRMLYEIIIDEDRCKAVCTMLERW